MGKNAQRKRALKEERKGRQASAEDVNLNVETKNESGGVVDEKYYFTDVYDFFGDELPVVVFGNLDGGTVDVEKTVTKCREQLAGINLVDYFFNLLLKGLKAAEIAEDELYALYGIYFFTEYVFEILEDKELDDYVDRVDHINTNHYPFIDKYNNFIAETFGGKNHDI